jgi:hypothetical protein
MIHVASAAGNQYTGSAPLHNLATCLASALQHAGDIAATGAITGTLFGVQHGVLALPGDLLARLELADVVRVAADDLIVGYDPNQAWRDRYPGCYYLGQGSADITPRTTCADDGRIS